MNCQQADFIHACELSHICPLSYHLCSYGNNWPVQHSWIWHTNTLIVTDSQSGCTAKLSSSISMSFQTTPPLQKRSHLNTVGLNLCRKHGSTEQCLICTHSAEAALSNRKSTLSKKTFIHLICLSVPSCLIIPIHHHTISPHLLQLFFFFKAQVGPSNYKDNLDMVEQNIWLKCNIRLGLKNDKSNTTALQQCYFDLSTNR